MLNIPCNGFGNFIKESREFKNLSLETLANKLEVSKVVVERLEIDLLYPTNTFIKKLSNVLNVDEIELFNLIWCENKKDLN